MTPPVVRSRWLSFTGRWRRAPTAGARRRRRPRRSAPASACRRCRSGLPGRWPRRRTPGASSRSTSTIVYGTGYAGCTWWSTTVQVCRVPVPATGAPLAVPAAAAAAVRPRQVQQRAARRAGPHDELAAPGRLEEAARVVVVVDRQQRRGYARAHESLRRISALPGGSGVFVTRHVSAPVDLGRARAADLAHALDDVVHAVDVALGQVAAAGVDRQAAAELDGPARHERPALALGAEPVVLELQQDGDREAVVELGDVDVRRPEAGPPVQRVGRRLGRQRRDVVAQHDRELDAGLR